MSNLFIAFSLTLFAGLSTGIGSLMALKAKKNNATFLSFSLGLSAGVMIYVSFMEIQQKAITSLVSSFGDKIGNLLAIISFFVGILFIAAIDKLLPTMGNPHEAHSIQEMKGDNQEHKDNLMRMGVFTAIAIAIHNFPEGLATFISALEDPSVGLSIALAVALHNIPEGIAVAVPLYYATGDKKKAFKYSFLSGLAEPLGAILGYFLLLQFLPEEAFGFIFGFVSGIMVYISLDELLPTAIEYKKHHVAILGLVSGMLIMALSLFLFI